MVLAPGTGVTVGTDGLRRLGTGLATGGDALYLYLPGPDGSSAGSDNVYLDFISWEGGGAGPPGIERSRISPAPADNAYYIGNTAADQRSRRGLEPLRRRAAWASTTPGDPNPSQDLSGLRGESSAPHVILTESGGSTDVAEGGGPDTYTIQLSTIPAGPVQIQASSGPQTEVGPNGQRFFGAFVTLVVDRPVAASDLRPRHRRYVDRGPMVVLDDANNRGQRRPGLFGHPDAGADGPGRRSPTTTVLHTPIDSIQGPGSVLATGRHVVDDARHRDRPEEQRLFSPGAGRDGGRQSGHVGRNLRIHELNTDGEARRLRAGVGTVSEFVPAADPHQPPLTELIARSRCCRRATHCQRRWRSPLRCRRAKRDRSCWSRSRACASRCHRSRSSGRPWPPRSTSRCDVTSSGVFYGAVKGVARPFREAGIDVNEPLPVGAPCCVPRFDGNPERLRWTATGSRQRPPRSQRRRRRDGQVGPLDYGFRTYTFCQTGICHRRDERTFPPVPGASPDEIVVAGFNLSDSSIRTNDPPSTSRCSPRRHSRTGSTRRR